MSYRVEIAKRVEKYLVSLRDAVLQRRLVAAMRGLKSTPRPPGCVKLAGSKDLFRLRIGDYRILYQVRDDVLVVLVIEIGHRREVYR